MKKRILGRAATAGLFALLALFTYGGSVAHAQAAAPGNPQLAKFKQDIAIVNMALAADDKCTVFTKLSRIAAQAKFKEMASVGKKAGIEGLDKYLNNIKNMVANTSCEDLGKNKYLQTGKAGIDQTVERRLSAWFIYLNQFDRLNLGNGACKGGYWSNDELWAAVRTQKHIASKSKNIPDKLKIKMAQNVKNMCESDTMNLSKKPVDKAILAEIWDANSQQPLPIKFGETVYANRGEAPMAEYPLNVAWAVEGSTKLDLKGNVPPLTVFTMLGEQATRVDVYFWFTHDRKFILAVDSGKSNTSFGAKILEARIEISGLEKPFVLNKTTKTYNPSYAGDRFGYVVFAEDDASSKDILAAVRSGGKLQFSFTRSFSKTSDPETLAADTIDHVAFKQATTYAFAPKLPF